MGNHRAERRGSGRRPSDLPTPVADTRPRSGERRAVQPRHGRPRPPWRRPSSSPRVEPAVRSSVRRTQHVRRATPSSVREAAPPRSASAGTALRRPRAAVPRAALRRRPARRRRARRLRGRRDHRCRRRPGRRRRPSSSQASALSGASGVVPRQPARPRDRSAATPAATPSTTPPTPSWSPRPRARSEQRNAALAQFAQQAAAAGRQARPQPVGAARSRLPPDRRVRRVRPVVAATTPASTSRRPPGRPDPRGRQRRRHLGRLRRRLRQQDRASPSRTAPRSGTATRRRSASARARRSAPARSSATSAPPAT